MTIIRPLNFEELKEAVRLADLVFRDSDQPSMGAAFPNMFSSHLSGQSYGAFEEGRLVSFLGLVPSIVQMGPARLKTYSLGSVCTHPDFRGKGYAGEILKEVISHADKARASLLLVSGSRSLYRRADCHPFGDAQRFSLDGASAQSLLDQASPTLNFRELEPTDWLELVEVSRSRTAYFEQSVWDLSVLIEAEAFASVNKHRHKVLVAEEDGCIAGFIVLGVPFAGEVRPVVYERAGDHEVVSALMAYAVQSFHLNSLDIPVSWYEHDLRQTLSSLSSKKERNFGTVKVIRAERLLEQLRPFLQMKDAKLNNQINACSVEEGRVELQIGRKRTVFSDEEFVSLLFDKEPKNDQANRIDHSLASLFPIPFPYTAGLNYV
ncbi:MAG TPA: GNAT family N-acetyltransferase [Bacillales bacterium]